MSKPSPLRRDTHRRGGFTLLEVVIALAIFVFGALAIIRIFPPALGVIQNSGDQLVAVNLNRSTVNRYAKSVESIPYATYGIGTDADDADNDGVTAEPYPLPVGTIGTVRRNNALPAGFLPRDFQNSSLNFFKNISGEKQTVRSFGAGRFYVLTSFPYSGTPAIYREGILENVQTKTIAGNNSGVLEWTPIPTATDYFASYNYLEGGYLHGTNDEAIRVNFPLPPLPYQLLQGRRLAGRTTDKVVDGPIRVRYREPLSSAPVTLEPNLGLVELPASAAVRAGEQVTIDYTVADWRRLVQDNLPNVTPEATPAPITGDPTPRTPRELVLPIRLLSEEPVYSLIGYLDPADTATPRTMVALQTAEWTASNAILPKVPNTSTDPTFLWSVNRKTGRVLFDLNTHVTTPPVRTLTQARVVYSTLDGWAHQVSVAPTHYTPLHDTPVPPTLTTTLSNPPEPWRYYAWSPTTRQGSIFFPPSEAGKTILLSYTYYDGTTDREVRDEVLTISERLVTPITDAAPFAVDNQVAEVVPKPALSGPPFPIKAIRAVRGASVQARTAWLNGDRYTQASTVTFRGATTQ